MTSQEFRQLSFAEARSRLLAELKLGANKPTSRPLPWPDQSLARNVWPLRFRSKGDLTATRKED